MGKNSDLTFPDMSRSPIMSPNENPHARTIRINISKPIIDNSNDLLENMDIFFMFQALLLSSD